ncbi:MFS transporter [Trueperella bernardiae]|uniref:MFS transporter n=1 Tax=Trueperella bernardiae TaxID=59561 RepID=UPI0029498687|nr:MFS transporter [Trueperella bernardiae]MDV6238279.1 MFS transporter [Trueperella bernardiae]
MRQARKKQRISRSLEQWLVILAVSLISLVAFEALAVATAMPYVVDILDGRNLYALASGVTLATQLITTAFAGPWCDAKGPKVSLYTGLALFTGGLIVATLAPSVEIIVLGRAIQGLGGGLIVVPLYVFVGNYVEPARQPRIFSSFAAAWVLPSLVGPLVAGFFVEHLNWRLVFGIVPVLLILSAPVILKQFGRFPDLHEHQPVSGYKRTVAFSSTAGVVILGIQLLSGLSAEEFDAKAIALVIGLSALVLFLARPLLPRATFRARRGLPATVLLRLAINGTYIAVEVFLPLMLKEVHGWSATQAGMIMTFGSVTWAIGSWVSGRVTDERYRAAAPVVGTLVQAFGTAATITAASASVPGATALIGWLVAGFGIGLVYPALTVHALALTPPERHGRTSASLSIADTLGSALFVAWCGIIYVLTLPQGHAAFVWVIGTMTAILAVGVWVGSRVLDVTPASLSATTSEH